jgi:hypothetical protein
MALYGNMLDGTKVKPEDEEHRKKVIDALKIVKGWDLISNPYEYMIDLTFVNHDMYVGIEIEEAQVDGDYVSQRGYSNFLYNGTPQILDKTLNYPPRKGHYWINGKHYYKYGRYAGQYWYTETDAEKNIFLRTNKDVTQIMIGYPHIILDKEKILHSSKKAYNITTGFIEDWTAIPLQYVEIYNFNKKTNLWELFVYKPFTVSNEVREKLLANQR